MSTRPVMSITDDQIAEIEALAGCATPGPWGLTLDRDLSVASSEWGLFDIRQDQPNFAVDAHYAAAANPASVLGLITRLRESERDAARYRFIREVASGHPEDFEVVASSAFAAAYGCDHNFDLNIDEAMLSAREAAE